MFAYNKMSLKKGKSITRANNSPAGWTGMEKVIFTERVESGQQGYKPSRKICYKTDTPRGLELVGWSVGGLRF